MPLVEILGIVKRICDADTVPETEAVPAQELGGAPVYCMVDVSVALSTTPDTVTREPPVMLTCPVTALLACVKVAVVATTSRWPPPTGVNVKVPVQFPAMFAGAGGVGEVGLLDEPPQATAPKRANPRATN